MRPVTRREMLRVGFLGAAGLTLGEFLKLQARAAVQDPPTATPSAAAPVPAPLADSVIYIFLEGGMSHIDSFDPKPMAPIEIRGELGTVGGNVPGVQFSGLWRQTARIADKLAVIRSMTHGEAAHERGTHNMLTGYKPSPAVTYPSMGSVVAHELGMRRSLPPYICVPDASSGSGFAGTGYLSSAFGPFSLGGEPQSDQFVVRDLNPPPGVDETRMARRRGLLNTVDAHFAAAEKSDALDAMETFYQRAYDLISSPSAREAFNIQAEPAAVRDAYGRTAIGQRLLMARRLIEAGTRFVTVFFGGWDMHVDVHAGMRKLVPPLDQAYAALLGDLESRGLLGKTLVVLSTEFGRTTRINKDRGRDHWPKVFSIAFAGGGVRGGQVIGESNAYATEPRERPVTPGDVAATLFTQLGIDPSKNLLAPGDRPIRIVREGAAIAGLV
ncbi:MAG: DUF1501 domain-containing protein [Phycisphaerales bacterium]|nr:DUF1501 domain-containing protein [Phycisphaerales bacterium]